jgi:hypothetical protein
MLGALHLVDSYVHDSNVSVDNKRELSDLKHGCSSVLLALENTLAGFRLGQSRLGRILSTESEISDQTNRLENFYQTLRGYVTQFAF